MLAFIAAFNTLQFKLWSRSNFCVVVWGCCNGADLWLLISFFAPWHEITWTGCVCVLDLHYIMLQNSSWRFWNVWYILRNKSKSVAVQLQVYLSLTSSTFSSAYLSSAIYQFLLWISGCNNKEGQRKREMKLQICIPSVSTALVRLVPRCWECGQTWRNGTLFCRRAEQLDK